MAREWHLRLVGTMTEVILIPKGFPELDPPLTDCCTERAEPVV